MRGIEKGQRVELILTPEVLRLVAAEAALEQGTSTKRQVGLKP